MCGVQSIRVSQNKIKKQERNEEHHLRQQRHQARDKARSDCSGGSENSQVVCRESAVFLPKMHFELGVIESCFIFDIR